MNRLQTVNDERRKQQHYNSIPSPFLTGSRKNNSSKSSEVYSLGSSLLTHTQSVSILISNRDSRTCLLETHQIHISSSSTSHSKPWNTLRSIYSLKTHLTEKTTTSTLLNELVSSKSNTHRHNSSRAVCFQDISAVRLSRSIAVAVVEDSIVCLIEPLPQNNVECLGMINKTKKHSGRGKKHSDLNRNVSRNETGHSTNGIDDLVCLGMLH